MYYFFPTLKFSGLILNTIEELARWIDDDAFFEALNLQNSDGMAFEYSWLWQFFAEP